jgi:uncharacterized protein YeaO (DUF488 family)
MPHVIVKLWPGKSEEQKRRLAELTGTFSHTLKAIAACPKGRCGHISRMAVRVIRLGTKRTKDEGLRIGTVRRPPRGVPKSQFATQNWYDVWFPNLAPSLGTMKIAQQATTPTQWRKFVKQYRAEMATPENSHAIELLAALSHHSNFSVGCYCENEAHCHRSILRKLLAEKGAGLKR